ncbi:MAG: hypothetical protein IJ842_01330 [Bacilli bacterium]|nr:hypothetical protein [Bacilli bacterium]
MNDTLFYKEVIIPSILNAKKDGIDTSDQDVKMFAKEAINIINNDESIINEAYEELHEKSRQIKISPLTKRKNNIIQRLKEIRKKNIYNREKFIKITIIIEAITENEGILTIDILLILEQIVEQIENGTFNWAIITFSSLDGISVLGIIIKKYIAYRDKTDSKN